VSEREQSGEKSHEPTPHRIAEARRKGNVPKSNDVSHAAAYLGLIAALFVAGGAIVELGAGALTVFIAQPDRLAGLVLGPGGTGLAAAIIAQATAALLPVLLVPLVAVLLSLVAQRAITVSGEKLQPKLERLSVIKNAKQKFGPTGLMEFLKATVKLVAVGAALGLILAGELGRIVGAVRAEPASVVAMMGDLLMTLLLAAAAIAAVIAAIDLAWQRYDHRRKLRMTFQELKDEMKQTEGDPHMKAQRRKRAEAIATNRMLLDVPQADVVIVNPTHYAVALKWSRAPGSAPACIAKGIDAVALRIRERAEAAGVPIHSDPSCARALHESVEIGQEIRPEHYRAVAVAIRFAEKARRDARERGG
jgi:flagellar biosynthetic protein FlhB